MAEYIDRTKLKEDSEYNPVSGEYLSYSRGQIWNASVEKVIDISVLDKIRAEIVELTKCPYGIECLGANCPSNTDCMICGDHVLEILDKYRK